MSKINNKILLVILVVLAGAYFGNKYLGNKGERNFRSVLVDLDTANVDRILLTFPPSKGGQITINKVAPGKFTVTRDGTTDEGDKGMIGSMLASQVGMKPERLVSNSESAWQQYEVTDSTGVNVKMFAGVELLSEMYVGKFDFQQATRTMNTMVRIAGEDPVYAVDGFLSSIFNVQFDAVRDKTFLKADRGTITSVKAEYPSDSSFALSRVNGKWMINIQPADSAEATKYVNGLNFLNLREFVDDYQPSTNELMYRLTIERDSLESIVIDCYKPAEGYILHSSLNKNAYFQPGAINIFEKLFPPREQFMVKPVQSL